MNEKQTHFDWVFGIQWLVVCAVGVTVTGLVAFTASWIVGEVFDRAEAIIRAREAGMG